jgi:hypothetical protein
LNLGRCGEVCIGSYHLRLSFPSNVVNEYLRHMLEEKIFNLKCTEVWISLYNLRQSFSNNVLNEYLRHLLQKKIFNSNFNCVEKFLRYEPAGRLLGSLFSDQWGWSSTVRETETERQRNRDTETERQSLDRTVKYYRIENAGV